MKFYAIFKSDGTLLSYAHEGYQHLSLSNYAQYENLKVIEINEIDTKYTLKLIDGKIIKEEFVKV